MNLLKVGAIVLPLLTIINCGRPGHFSGGGQACIGFAEGPTPAASGKTTCQDLGGIADVSVSLNMVAQDRNNNGVIDPEDRFTGHLNLQGTKGEKLQSRVLYGGVCSEECLSGPSVSRLVESDLKTLPANVSASFASMSQSSRVRDFIRIHPGAGISVFLSVYQQLGNNPAKCFTDDNSEDCYLMLTLAADEGDVGPGIGDVFVTELQSGPGFAGVITKGNLSITSEVVPSGN